jgi:hypothetical protein
MISAAEHTPIPETTHPLMLIHQFDHHQMNLRQLLKIFRND